MTPNQQPPPRRMSTLVRAGVAVTVAFGAALILVVGVYFGVFWACALGLILATVGLSWARSVEAETRIPLTATPFRPRFVDPEETDQEQGA